MTVQCFARLRELAGAREWVCEVPAGATVADVWAQLAGRAPAVSALASAVSCAVNAEFASMSAPVHDGDEVAFLPPVSGGA
ncbi:MAG: molybdopterin converting factor subunit 1 [Vicinamibacterales bacterium]